jgi:hypothetical protein
VGTQFTIIKLAGSNGAFLWSQDSDPGTALSVAVDAHGNVIAGGSTNSTFTVTKLHGSDGSNFGPGSDAELSASPTTTTTPGGTVTGTWSGVTTPTATDWIGLYAVGTGNEAYLDWLYVGCTQTPTSEYPDGACQFELWNIPGPGLYELRLFAQDGFTLLAASNPFTVENSGAVSLSVSPTFVQPGSAVIAAWSSIPVATATDWLGLYVRNAPHTDYIEWLYVNCQTGPDEAHPTGSCAIVVPPGIAFGEYEVRLFAADSFAWLGTSNVFRIVPFGP